MVKRNYTLIELIVVITILFILLISSSLYVVGYIVKSRNVKRLNDLSLIVKSFINYSNDVVEKDFPYPDNMLKILYSGNIVLYQGKVGDTVAKKIGLNKPPKDPSDKEFYTYSLSIDRKRFAIATFLEDEKIFFSKNAVNNAYGYSIGDKIIKKGGTKSLGILIYDNINFVENVFSGNIDFKNRIDKFIYYLKDNVVLEGSGDYIGKMLNLIKYDLYYSCKDILNNRYEYKNKDGLYVLFQNDNAFLVYCNMSIDGGGWILLANKTTAGDIITGIFGKDTVYPWNKSKLLFIKDTKFLSNIKEAMICSEKYCWKLQLQDFMKDYLNKGGYRGGININISRIYSSDGGGARTIWGLTDYEYGNKKGGKYMYFRILNKYLCGVGGTDVFKHHVGGYCDNGRRGSICEPGINDRCRYTGALWNFYVR